ncbi:uncharacterized protein EHS24_008967 [Apiotrichum porosum]|uniref:SCP domain-containing protein n=1 Tax=Apiotrichum porosum TaxID=105984 RepID=A0A427XN98_9TREE|nr:uncharacterized protein EHS24_008967 [Apiotrichum porosum]RSH80391.1 hypothetical protein EHS24_008967 [Apiotrichum porosum]
MKIATIFTIIGALAAPAAALPQYGNFMGDAVSSGATWVAAEPSLADAADTAAAAAATANGTGVADAGAVAPVPTNGSAHHGHGSCGSKGSKHHTPSKGGNAPVPTPVVGSSAAGGSTTPMSDSTDTVPTPTDAAGSPAVTLANDSPPVVETYVANPTDGYGQQATADIQSTAVSTDAAASTGAASGGASGSPTLPVDSQNNKITANPSAEDIAGTSDASKWVVSYYNQWRKEFGAGEVVWNATLAQDSADHTKACNMSHQGDDNLAWMWASGTAPDFAVSGNLDGWASEWKDYPFDNPAANAYSHFTEMVWKGTTQIGCSWNVDCDPTKGDLGDAMHSMVYFTCKHFVAGNMLGAFGENVGKFVGS